MEIRGSRAAIPVTETSALASPFVNMSKEEAVTLVHAHFGISGQATRFATEKDDTFRIDAKDGGRYVFKAANPSEDPAEIAFQGELLEHVSIADPQLPVPHLVPGSGGKTQLAITDSAGQRRQIRLMTYLPGVPLGSADPSRKQRERLGEVLGRLQLAMAGFAHSAGDRVLAWDVRHLSGLRPLLDRVEDLNRRRQLAAGFERFKAFERRLDALRRQVVHNDFSTSNIMVDPARAEFVTGILDFGDAVRTAVAVDVSTALLNQLPASTTELAMDDIFFQGRDLLRGYLRVADLSHEELALIPHLTMARVIARSLLTLWRAQLFPGNATYILRNTPGGWSQLDWFLGRSAEEVSEMLLAELKPTYIRQSVVPRNSL